MSEHIHLNVTNTSLPQATSDVFWQTVTIEVSTLGCKLFRKLCNRYGGQDQSERINKDV
jgi:hypothetical protein